MSFTHLLQASLARGLTLVLALVALRDSGASPAEAALAVRQVTGASPAEARAAVARSRAWAVPREGAPNVLAACGWSGPTGRHGRSGHGAASVLAHLARPGR